MDSQFPIVAPLQVKANGFEEALTDSMRGLATDMFLYRYYCDKSSSNNNEPLYQSGVIRTNCLDCLDRTNAFQWYMCWTWIMRFLQERGLDMFLIPGFKRSGTAAVDCVRQSLHNKNNTVGIVTTYLSQCVI